MSSDRMSDEDDESGLQMRNGGASVGARAARVFRVHAFVRPHKVYTNKHCRGAARRGIMVHAPCAGARRGGAGHMADHGSCDGRVYNVV